MNSDEVFYEIVINEIEREGPRKGLWGKAFAKAGGVDNIAKAYYIELRVEQLKIEIAAQVANAAEAERKQTEFDSEQERLREEADIKRQSVTKLLEHGCSREAIDYLKNPIHIYAYMQKYKKSENKILEAIKNGKLRGCYVKEALWIEDKKF